MRRREIIVFVGAVVCVATTGSFVVRAQQAAMPVIGFLNVASPELFATRVAAFFRGLSEFGYVEGRNVSIEYRWANGDYAQLPALASDLARRQVNVIAATGGIPSAIAAKEATPTIPVVFVAGSDPVKFGLIANLNRPGGNVTGLTALTSELVPKRLELVHTLTTSATSIALLVNPNNPISRSLIHDVQAEARRLNLQLHVLEAGAEQELDTAFSTLANLRTGALVIGTDGFFDSQSAKLGAMAARLSMPTIYQTREFAAAGGLLSYGASLVDAYRLAGVYVGSILKGEKPGDLPVQQSTKVDFTINLKTAKALGLTIPPTLLARADEVIE